MAMTPGNDVHGTEGIMATEVFFVLTVGSIQSTNSETCIFELNSYRSFLFSITMFFFDMKIMRT